MQIGGINIHGFTRNQVNAYTLGVSCGNTKRSVKQSCRRCIVATNTLLIFIKEGNRNVFLGIKLSVIAQIIACRALNIFRNLLYNFRIICAKALSSYDLIHIGSALCIYSEIFVCNKIVIIFLLISNSAGRALLNAVNKPIIVYAILIINVANANGILFLYLIATVKRRIVGQNVPFVIRSYNNSLFRHARILHSRACKIGCRIFAVDLIIVMSCLVPAAAVIHAVVLRLKINSSVGV